MLAESVLKTWEVPLEDIFCDDDFNCRGSIAPIDVIDLARSIDDNGLQQPITVQPYDVVPGKKYRILSGHRRFRAFQLIIPVKDTIPAIINAEEMSELDARKLNLEENLKRKDLNILQEARAIQPFLKAGWTQEEISAQLGQPKGWVHIRIALLKLPTEIQEVAATGLLTQDQIRQLGSIKSRNQQFEAVKKIKESKLSGEKKKVDIKPRKNNPLSKKRREPAEITAMIDQISKVVGMGFYTRCLAWSSGEISEFDLLRDLRDFAGEQGITWDIPKEILDEARSFKK